MTRSWLSVRVELLGGRSEDLWPYPGRVFVVGPSHTFAAFANAIDGAFARWDRTHLCRFTLADGTVVTDQETGEEWQDETSGRSPRAPLVLDQTRVADRLRPGDEARYVFDLGDNWTHACTVEDQLVDPVEVLGAVPKAPTAVWGWGSIPDQYGRRWDGDGSDEPIPRRPSAPHPMRRRGWPSSESARPIDLQELRGATYRRDVAAILAAVDGRELDDLLQHVGTAVQVAFSADPDRVDAMATALLGRLDERGWVGDDVLAEDLLGLLRDDPPQGRQLPVDLAQVADELSGDRSDPSGCLDLHTGEVVPGMLFDPMYGDDEVIDVDEDPDRWLRLDPLGSREGWRDMKDFSAAQTSTEVRERLESAIGGKGAFRRFKDAVYELDLVAQWRRFSEDREIGRARAYLAGEGIRVLPPQ